MEGVEVVNGAHGWFGVPTAALWSRFMRQRRQHAKLAAAHPARCPRRVLRTIKVTSNLLPAPQEERALKAGLVARRALTM